jgi:hypothetical protein
MPSTEWTGSYRYDHAASGLYRVRQSAMLQEKRYRFRTLTVSLTEDGCICKL